MGIRAGRGEERRKNNIRNRKPIILLALEGKNKTERYYFTRMAATQSKFSIRIVPGNFTDAKNLADSIIKYRKRIDIGNENGDAAFCVFDLDADVDKAHVARVVIDSEIKSDFQCIVSNPCFEVWYLLHFNYSTKQYFYSDEILEELRKWIPEYTKSTDMFQLLDGIVTNKAIRNAKQLEAFQKELGMQRGDVDANPVTEVYKIVELLLNSCT